MELQSTNPDPKSSITKLLSTLADGLEPDDVGDFVSIAQHYALATPSSYRRVSLVSFYELTKLLHLRFTLYKYYKHFVLRCSNQLYLAPNPF